LATHKSALKRHRQSIKKNLVNTAQRTRLRNMVKAVVTALDDRDKEAATGALLSAIPVLQRAANRGIIHRNTASRNISRLTQKVNALSAAAPAEAPAKGARKAGKPRKA
jgi:small subunit ribosomal protein S20